MTELEGGPFLAIAGGLMLLIGGIGELLASPSTEGTPGLSRGRWEGPSTPPPQAVS